MNVIALETLPQHIQNKMNQLFDLTEHISNNAYNIVKTVITEPVSFQYKHQKDSDILTEDERAQSICFISRFEHLPELQKIKLVKQDNGYHIENLGEIRHILNEYRTIIQNQSDSIHYSKIHAFCIKKLKNNDPTNDLSISARGESGVDKTDLVIKMLNERNKSVKYILENSDYKYLYNGILQHSDHSYTNQFLEDYHTGELNYIFLRHAFLLGHIKELLKYHHLILNVLTSPKLGSL